MTRVHFGLLILSVMAILQGCASLGTKSEGEAVDRETRIIHFADSLGAVYEGGKGATVDETKFHAILAAFEFCRTSRQLAFVTPPIEFAPNADYKTVSAYDLEHGRFLAESARVESPMFVAPFECIDQKHGLEAGILESHEVTTMTVHDFVGDSRGAVVAVKVEPNITGLKNGDMVLAIAGKRVETRNEFAKIIDWLPVGPMKYTVIRANSVIQVDGDIVDLTPMTLKTAKTLLTQICIRLHSSSKACSDTSTVATNEQTTL